MVLTRTLIVVFVALYCAVDSLPHQTHNETNNGYGNIALRTSPNRDVLRLHKNFRVKPHLKASRSHGKLNSVMVSAFNLGGMIKCGTECNRVYLLHYGNYCGMGGSGLPIDNIDRCCKKHDECYERVRKRFNKATWSMYFGKYSWNCNHGKPSCIDANQLGGWRLDLCNCDLRFIECLNKFGCPRG